MVIVALATATSRAGYEGLADKGSGTESIESRFPPPEGFRRVVVAPGSYQEWLRRLPLLPRTTVATDWQNRPVFRPEEVGGVLDWRLLGSVEQCADIAIRLMSEHAYAEKPGTSPRFRSLSGQDIQWAQWLEGEYSTNPSGTAIVYREGRSRPGNRREFDAFLRFVMNYTNTASMARDWREVKAADLRIGDVIIQPHCTGAGMGHLSVVIDAIENDSGDRRYLFVDGYTPARLPVVRQRLEGQPGTVWMTIEEYLEFQQQFGPGEFHRPPEW